MPIIDRLTEAALDYAAKKLTEPSGNSDRWVTLISSNLERFYRDSSDNTMIIQFKGQREYKYFNISEEMADELANAGSPGGWWHENLKGAPAQRL